ncbi:hypothetical protein [Aliterella atlantica]|uniref:hypothetical protein n=1 Tax=Aliterella atlantica TaxID=1827278 RepID=UPI0013649F54|nr:hypothetical protein [Aliterella atlantica]
MLNRRVNSRNVDGSLSASSQVRVSYKFKEAVMPNDDNNKQSWAVPTVVAIVSTVSAIAVA